MLLSCGPAVPGFILHRGLQGRKSGLLLLYSHQQGQGHCKDPGEDVVIKNPTQSMVAQADAISLESISSAN